MKRLKMGKRGEERQNKEKWCKIGDPEKMDAGRRNDDDKRSRREECQVEDKMRGRNRLDLRLDGWMHT